MMDLEPLIRDFLSLGITLAVISAMSLPFSFWAIIHIWGWPTLLAITAACTAVGVGIWAGRRF